MDASQGEAVKRAAEETVKPQTQRFRVNVPAADEAVLEWMAAQYNHSLSVRILIREAIERHGYIDIMNRPVAQLPKRGRPAGLEEEPAAGPAQPDPAPVLQLVPPVTPSAPAASTDLDLTEEPARAPELLGIALASPSLAPTVPAHPQVDPADPAPAPSNPEPSSGNQVDVNDIFTSMR